MDKPADQHLLKAAENLRDLLNDRSIPEEIRAELEADYAQVEAMTEKLDRGEIHLAVFGKVSAGKSSLLNALVGEALFSVSPLHGETRQPQTTRWHDARSGGVHLIDTPGINELDGEAREKLAFEVAERADLVVFVLDGDISQAEIRAMRIVAAAHRPILAVLNKTDRYTAAETAQLLAALRAQCEGLVQPGNILPVAASPRPQTVIVQNADGSEREEQRAREPDVQALKERIWEVLEAEGKTLAALNAALFAGRLTDQVSTRLVKARRQIAEKVLRTYSLTKGVAVALNPVPVADLLAAAALDVALVAQLSRVYGLPMTRRESGRVLATIAAQLAALMGAVWGVHLVSSALKTLSAGFSVAVTGVAQGALAYYATYLVGRAAEAYLINGKSWGSNGPKQTVRDIVGSLDRQSILAEAKSEISTRLKKPAT
ncbi:MAG: GTP-binding protein [Pseudomonadota bacterium]